MFTRVLYIIISSLYPFVVSDFDDKRNSFALGESRTSTKQTWTITNGYVDIPISVFICFVSSIRSPVHCTGAFLGRNSTDNSNETIYSNDSNTWFSCFILSRYSNRSGSRAVSFLSRFNHLRFWFETESDLPISSQLMSWQYRIKKCFKTRETVRGSAIFSNIYFRMIKRSVFRLQTSISHALSWSSRSALASMCHISFFLCRDSPFVLSHSLYTNSIFFLRFSTSLGLTKYCVFVGIWFFQFAFSLLFARWIHFNHSSFNHGSSHYLDSSAQ